MTDETHLFDDLSLSVTSLKQHAVMKIAKALISADWEVNCNVFFLFDCYSVKRSTDKIKQLHLPNCLKREIRDVILCLSRILRSTISLPPCALRFNACGDLDVHRTFDNCMDYIQRGPRPSWTYLMTFLRDACDFHQERSIHLTLCEFLRWNGSKLEPSLRHARCEVNVRRDEYRRWYYNIRFVIEEEVDDPSAWKFFASTLNAYLSIEFSFEGNVFSVTQRNQTQLDMNPLWSKLTTPQKLEYAEEFFQAALKQSDTRFLIQTMRYVHSSRRINLIKRNLLSFILCFLVHPYYRRFLPDLKLVEEDLQLVRKENELGVIVKVLKSLLGTRDFNNISDSLIRLWYYVSSRNHSIGDHVFRNIRTILYDVRYRWNLQADDDDDDAKEHIFKLRAVFPAK